MAAVDVHNSGFNERTQFPASELTRYAGDSAPARNETAPPPVTADNSAFYALSDGTVRQLALDVDAGTGETDVIAEIGASPVGSPAIEGDFVYVPADDGRLYQVAVGGGGFFSDYSKGDVRWTYPNADAVPLERITGGVTVTDGNVLLASENAIHSVSTDGSVRWRFPMDNSPKGPVAHRDGFTYVGGENGVVAVSAEGGKPKEVWRNERGTDSHVVAAHNRLFLTDSRNSEVVSIARRSATGDPWPSTDATPTTASRETATDDDGSLDLPTIGRETPISKPEAPVGHTEWSVGAGGMARHSPVTAPTITPSALLVGTDSGVVALDPATGKYLWSFDGGREHRQPVASGGLVYVIDDAGIIHILDTLANGKEIASIDTGLEPSSPPTVFKRTILQTGGGNDRQAIDAITGSTGVELLEDPIEKKRELAKKIDEKTRTHVEDEKMANQAIDRIKSAVEADELSVGVGRESIRRLTDAERLTWYASNVYYGGLDDSDEDGQYDHLPVSRFVTNEDGEKVPNDEFLTYQGTVHDDAPLPLVERTAMFVASTAVELALALVPTKTLKKVKNQSADTDDVLTIAQYADKVDEEDGRELLDAAEGAKRQNDPLTATLKSMFGGSSILSNPIANAAKEIVRAIETAHTSGVEAAKDAIENSDKIPERVQECLLDALDEVPTSMLVNVPGVGHVIVGEYLLDMVDVVKACLADVIRPGLERLVEQGCGYDTDQSLWPDWEDAVRKSCKTATDTVASTNPAVKGFEAFDEVTLGRTLRQATNTDEFDRLKRYDRLPGTRQQTRRAMSDGIQLMRIIATFTHEMVDAAKLNLANEGGKTAVFTSRKNVLTWMEDTFGATAEEGTWKEGAILGSYYAVAAVLDVLKNVFTVGHELGKALVGLGSLYSINHAHSTASRGILRGKAEVDHL